MARRRRSPTGAATTSLRGFLATNTASGSFTIQNGANVTSASSGFSNAGTVNIGANSTFTVGGSHDYVQSVGITTLGSSSSVLAVASGHAVDINGGTLQGFGTLQGNLVNSGGTVLPGSSGTAGILTVTGTYSDPFGGDVHFQIGGLSPGTGFSQLDMTGLGASSLTGSSFDVSLINGFTPTTGEHFEVLLTSGGLNGTTFTNSTFTVDNIIFTASYINNDNDVLLIVAAPPCRSRRRSRCSESAWSVWGSTWPSSHERPRRAEAASRKFGPDEERRSGLAGPRRGGSPGRIR